MVIMEATVSECPTCTGHPEAMTPTLTTILPKAVQQALFLRTSASSLGEGGLAAAVRLISS